MNVKEKLNVFSRLALKEAEEKRDTIMSGLNSEFDAACREYSAKARKKAEAQLREDGFKAEREKNKEILTAKFDSRRALFEYKAQLIGGIFERVMDMIADYVETDEYGADIIGGIRELSIKYGCEIDVYITGRDMVFSEKIKETPNINLFADDSLIGGYKAVIGERGLIIDRSYLERLNAVRSDFRGFNIS